LPISGRSVELARPGSADELVTLDEPDSLAGSAALACRLVEERDRGGTRPLDVGGLPIGDLDAIVVHLRCRALGDSIVGEATCPGCSEMVDVPLRLLAYLRHRRPRPTRAARQGNEPGWWELHRYPLQFRLPTVSDLREVAGSAGARAELLDRCVRGTTTPRSVRSAERAMAVLGPTLRSSVSGPCPECAASMELTFDAREYCYSELRTLSVAVLDEVHLLASAYHWSEADILALPPTRRKAYAELIAGGSGPGAGVLSTKGWDRVA
jgi:hypothetical protein